MKIAYLAHSRLKLHALPIVKIRRRLSFPERQSGPHAYSWRQFDGELIPPFVKDGGIHDASAQDYSLLRAGVNAGRWSGAV